MRATDWPQFQTPLSGSCSAMPSMSKSNLTRPPMSGNCNFLPFSCSMRLISAAVAFLKTREEPLKGFMTMTVERSSALTIRSLKDWGKMLHSTVALKRVPTCTPAAPRARAATSCRPVAQPPDARKGMRRDFLARANVTKRPTSASPGKPPESNPIRETMSEPSLSCAVSALRTCTHLEMITLTPLERSRSWIFDISGMLPPHVSTMRMPLPQMTSQKPSGNSGAPRFSPSSVRFTAKGLDVSRRHRAISSWSLSGVLQWRQVSMPRHPALETAAASSAEPVAVMPPQTMGCSMPSISVATVRSMAPRWCGGRREQY
mmetsp:Transcript_60797/g.181144  ORF Transcript_60797/g.181144 Transcript_60797/m.181144 type:complete len:317 (+) Transcript_60797:141-1091(+)